MKLVLTVSSNLNMLRQSVESRILDMRRQSAESHNLAMSRQYRLSERQRVLETEETASVAYRQ